MFELFGSIGQGIAWINNNLLLTALGLAALATLGWWWRPVVEFFTTTQIGRLLGAGALAFGTALLWLKKDRETQYQRGRADENAKWREKLSPKAPAKQRKAEWWLGKK